MNTSIKVQGTNRFQEGSELNDPNKFMKLPRKSFKSFQQENQGNTEYVITNQLNRSKLLSH